MNQPPLAPDVCKKVSARLLKEALELIEQGDWPEAREHIQDALIWMEGVR